MQEILNLHFVKFSTLTGWKVHFFLDKREASDVMRRVQPIHCSIKSHTDMLFINYTCPAWFFAASALLLSLKYGLLPQTLVQVRYVCGSLSLSSRSIYSMHSSTIYGQKGLCSFRHSHCKKDTCTAESAVLLSLLLWLIYSRDLSFGLQCS